MLADPRQLVRRPGDSLWVRIVDTPRALASRKYAADGRLVIELRDDFCPWNEGRYLLEADGGQARCSTTTLDADLNMTVNDLGALYLGGSRAHQLARANRIHGAPEAVAKADAMFTWHPLPWAPEVW